VSTAETDLPRQPTVEEIISSHASQPGALLPVLHALQDAFGYIAPAHVGVIASALNISRAEVHGVITFYHYFRQQPCGRHVVQVCRAEACQAMHGEKTEEHAKACLGVDYGGTSADGMFTLAAAYCLGNCAAAPSVMVGDKLYGRVTPERLDEVLADWRDRS
jgi:formate dehydrogenase subunit gamma